MDLLSGDTIPTAAKGIAVTTYKWPVEQSVVDDLERELFSESQVCSTGVDWARH